MQHAQKKKNNNTNPLYRMFKTDWVLSFATFPGRSFFPTWWTQVVSSAIF